MPADLRADYRSLAGRAQARFRLAAENRDKLPVVRHLLKRHEGQPTLIIGHYVAQLETIADRLGYLKAELAKPEEERTLRVPEEDAEQRSYQQ